MGEELRVEDITNQESLRAWLEAAPNENRQEWCVFIAYRASSRVAPFLWMDAISRGQVDLTDLRIWRIHPLISISHMNVSRGVQRATRRAARAARSATTATAWVSPARQATIAARAAVAAQASEVQAANTAATAFASADSASFEYIETVREETLADAHFLTRARAPNARRPLWGVSIPVALKGCWSNVQSALRQTETPEDWDFWIDWYEAELAGRPMLPTSEAHWDLLADIFEVNETSLLKEEDWEKGSAHVNPIIRAHYEEKLKQYGLVSPSRAERLRSEVERLDAELAAAQAEVATFKHRSHNQPPELVDTKAETARYEAALSEERKIVHAIELELSNERPESKKLAALGERLKIQTKRLARAAGAFAVVCVRSGFGAGKAISLYCVSLADIGTKEVVKKASALGGVYLSDKYLLNGRLLEMAEQLIRGAF